MRQYLHRSIFLCIAFCSLLYSFNFFSGNHHWYSSQDFHSLQSLSLIRGHIALPINPAPGIENDLQFYNGRITSHWGLGIPFLQMPFHFLLKVLKIANSFPSILIFSFYYLITANIILNFIQRNKIYNNSVIQIIFTLLILSFCLFWLTSYRFIVYEESASYFILFTLNTFIFYIEFKENPNNKNLFLLLLNLTFLLLIRATGLIIFAVIFLDLFLKKKIKRSKSIIFFLTPLLIFATSNYLTNGHLISTGLHNTNPGIPEELLPHRMGGPCEQFSIQQFFLRSLDFANAIFLGKKEIMNKCFTQFEDSIAIHQPYFSYLLSFTFAIFVYLSVKYKKITENFVITSGFFLIFFAYVFKANGFAYRYLVDFIFFILFVIYEIYKILKLHVRINPKYLNFLFSVIIIFSLFNLIDVINIQKNSVKFSSKPIDRKKLNWSFRHSPEAFPHIRSCKDNILFDRDKYGWHENCRVPNFINIYLSLPNFSNKKQYKLFIEGDEIPDIITMRFNGILYKNFNWHKDYVSVNRPFTNNFNLFIKFDSNFAQPLINRIYFQ